MSDRTDGPDDDAGPDANLELPSLSLGFRRRRRSAQSTEQPEPAGSVESTATDAPTLGTPVPGTSPEIPAYAEQTAPPVTEPDPVADPVAPPEPAPLTPIDPEPAPAPRTEPEPSALAEPDLQPDPEPTEVLEPVAMTAPTAPSLHDLYDPELDAHRADEPAARRRLSPRGGSSKAKSSGPATTPRPPRSSPPPRPERVSRSERVPQSERPVKGPRTSTRKRPELPTLGLPGLPERVAVAVTGAVVGLLMVVVADLFARGCSAARGTDTCGGGIGLFALVVTVVVAVVIGAVLLRSFAIPDSLSTSMLGVGVVVVIALVALIGVLSSVWMVLVFPILGVVGYLLAWWVTQTFVEVPDGHESERVS